MFDQTNLTEFRPKSQEKSLIEQLWSDWEQCRVIDNWFLGAQTSLEAFLKSRGGGGGFGGFFIFWVWRCRHIKKTVTFFFGRAVEVTIGRKTDQGINCLWPKINLINISLRQPMTKRLIMILLRIPLWTVPIGIPMRNSDYSNLYFVMGMAFYYKVKSDRGARIINITI